MRISAILCVHTYTHTKGLYTCTYVRSGFAYLQEQEKTLNLYAPTTDQPFIGGIMALLKRTPEQNAAFERCIGFLAEMIEKYSGKVEFPVLPADSKTSWDSLSNPSSQTNSEEPLTNDMAA